MSASSSFGESKTKVFKSALINTFGGKRVNLTVRNNERVMFENRFASYADGALFHSDTVQSWCTFMVSLDEGIEDGNTTFLVEPPVSIMPETGMAFFQHPLIYEGRVVKYVLRTDVMYHQRQ